MTKTLILFAVAVTLFVAAAWRYRRQASASRRLILLAAACFILVAVAHILESFRLLTGAGWGQPHSLGHYLDLSAALLGLILFGVGLLLSVARRSLS